MYTMYTDDAGIVSRTALSSERIMAIIVDREFGQTVSEAKAATMCMHAFRGAQKSEVWHQRC